MIISLFDFAFMAFCGKQTFYINAYFLVVAKNKQIWYNLWANVVKFYD